MIITWRDAPPVAFALSPVKRRANNVSRVGNFIFGAVAWRLLVFQRRICERCLRMSLKV